MLPLSKAKLECFGCWDPDREHGLLSGVIFFPGLTCRCGRKAGYGRGTEMRGKGKTAVIVVVARETLTDR